jgi:hypothetical protein
MMQWNETNLLLALNAAEVALWSWNVDTDKIMLAMFPKIRPLTFEDLSSPDLLPFNSAIWSWNFPIMIPDRGPRRVP